MATLNVLVGTRIRILIFAVRDLEGGVPGNVTASGIYRVGGILVLPELATALIVEIPAALAVIVGGMLFYHTVCEGVRQGK